MAPTGLWTGLVSIGLVGVLLFRIQESASPLKDADRARLAGVGLDLDGDDLGLTTGDARPDDTSVDGDALVQSSTRRLLSLLLIGILNPVPVGLVGLFLFSPGGGIGVMLGFKPRTDRFLVNEGLRADEGLGTTFGVSVDSDSLWGPSPGRFLGVLDIPWCWRLFNYERKRTALERPTS